MKSFTAYDNYVYTYTCPITDRVFYVGEGKGYRAWSHIKPSSYMPYDVNYPSHSGYIKKLHLLGQEPIVELIFEGTKEECLKKEDEMIEHYGCHDKGGCLLQFSMEHRKSKPWSEHAKAHYKEVCKKNRKFNFSYDFLYNKYVIQNLSRRQIAEEAGCSEILVKTRLKEHNIRKQRR